MKQEFHDKQDINTLSYEYIRGLVEGEGCFGFHSGAIKSNGNKYKIPAFIISMHARDKNLLEMIKNTLKLKNKIYIHKSDGFSHCEMATLVVRDFHQLKDIIIPLFYKKLIGYKNIQFMKWLEKIGYDKDISNRYKAIYRIYKFGIYDQSKFLNKFNNLNKK